MYFVRHGQSHFNLGVDQTGRDPGIVDAGLTPLGFSQALHAAEQLADKGLQEIICSPYTRAIQTASVISDRLGIPLQVDACAGEKCVYTCDIGTSARALQNLWPHLSFSHLDDTWWPDQNESHTRLTKRAALFLDKWEAKLRSHKLALVSHWYFLNHLTGRGFENGEVYFKKMV